MSSLGSSSGGGRLTGGRGLVSQSDLDTETSSLLGGRKSSVEGTRKPRSSMAPGTNGADFYTQLADSVGADNSFDDSDGDNDLGQSTQDEAKYLVQSVDLDDMDANLFKSFQSQRKDSKSRENSSKPSSVKKSEPPSEVDDKKTAAQLTEKEIGFHVIGSLKDKQNDWKDGSMNTTKSKDPKQYKTDFDDDLQDLFLSDSDEISPKRITKPKMQLTQKSNESTSVADGEPITSIKDTKSKIPDFNFEQPGTSWGDPPHGNSAVKSRHSENFESRKESGTGTNVLRLSSPASQSHTTSSKSSVQASKGVDFDEDNDDILIGMGLEDSSAPSLKQSSMKVDKPRQDESSSRLDDLLGVSKRRSKLDTGRMSAELSTKTKSNPDDFQFHGYVPSAVDSSPTHSKRSLKLPSGRRHGPSELEPSITARPNSVPSPAKKSVHFAQNLENTERPSSSSSLSMPMKTSLKTETNEKQTLEQAPASASEASVSRSKKPPLPVKTDVDDTEVMDDSTEDKGEENGGTKGKHFNPEDASLSASSGIDFKDSLFPSAASSPRPSSVVQGGRRPTSSPGDSLLKNSLPGVGSSPFESIPSEGSNTTSVTSSTDKPVPNRAAKQNQDESAPLNTDQKLEHPVFPWQNHKALVNEHSDLAAQQETTALDEVQPPSSRHRPPTLGDQNRSSDLPIDLNPKPVSFQEQFLQQQKLIQEQLMNFQVQSAGVAAAAQVSSKTEIDRLQGELNVALMKAKKLEDELGKKSVELSEKEKTLTLLERQLQTSKDTCQQSENLCKQTIDKNNTLDRDLTQVKLELSSQVEDLKIKLYKVELERDQLQHTVESIKSRHAEELDAIHKSHNLRVASLEESFQRREIRWREETEADSTRCQDKLTSLEQEKTDTTIALKKKLDAMEIAKSNEISRLQDIHHSSVEELKREHDLDKQHLLAMHRQELEAVKAAHSHTRMLSDLSHKVESSTRDVKHLQAKIEHTHFSDLDERLQRVKLHEEHLNTLEAQLMKQKVENDSEREKLQTLIAKMESHVSQQNKYIEDERWQLQQDKLRLTAQQSAFEDERSSSLMRLETERDKLQQAKEKLLAEQKEILSQCYEERKSLAAARVELSVLQKKALEREQRDKQASLQNEAEQEASLAHFREERDRIVSEGKNLRQDLEKLRVDREAVCRDREKLEAYGIQMQQRSREIEEMTEVAMLVRDKGNQSFAEGQRLQEELTDQVKAVQAHKVCLAEKEKLLVMEQLSLAQERRNLQHLRVMSSSTPLFDNQGEVLTQERIEPFSSSVHLLHQHDLNPSVSNSSLPSLKGATTEGIPLGASYSPSTSPVRSACKPLSSVKAMLAKIEHSRNLRNVNLDMKKDDVYLEEESDFLQSLQANPYNH